MNKEILQKMIKKNEIVKYETSNADSIVRVFVRKQKVDEELIEKIKNACDNNYMIINEFYKAKIIKLNTTV